MDQTLVAGRNHQPASSSARTGVRIASLTVALIGLSCGAANDGSQAATGAAEPPVKTSTADDLTADQVRGSVAGGRDGAYNQRASLVERGQGVYEKYCIGCHGVFGDGNGPAAPRLLTRPRDFTRGIYKFRSTDSSSLPLESDLHRTVTRGLARVSMPAFPLLPEAERLAVVEYVKAFYPGWEAEKDDRRLVPVPRAPADLSSGVRRLRGRVVYLQMGCGSCHGSDGRGTGATQTEYIDAWGDPQKPFDFTRGSLKGGNSAEDIYRTFHTGLQSIMPSFGGDTLAAATARGFEESRGVLEPSEAARLAEVIDQFPADTDDLFSTLSETERLALAVRNSWDLVAYILSLRGGEATSAAVPGGDG